MKGSSGKKYNIALDLQALYSMHSSRGIGNYVRGLFNGILEMDQLNEYYLVNFYGEVPAECKLVGGSNVHALNFYEQVKEYLLAGESKERDSFFERQIKWIIEEYAVDIWLVGAVVDPYNIYRASYFNIVKFVTVAHDVIPILFGKAYLKDYLSAKAYVQWFKQYIYSDYIFCNSETTKQDLIKVLGVNAKRTKTVYAGVSPIYKRKNYTREQLLKIKKQFGIENEYLFCVGADDFRKNLDSLVEAYLSMDSKLIHNCQLVITCSISNETINRIRQHEQLKGWENRIIITNYVNDEDMLILLSQAKLAVFPSMYEGFGLPVVEAWNCEIPVLTSNNSSLGEIARGAAIMVNPFSIVSIKSGLEYALKKENMDKLVTVGLARAQQYTWQKAAEKVISSYDNIIALDKVNINSNDYYKQCRRLKERCMRYVSTGVRIKYRIQEIYRRHK